MTSGRRWTVGTAALLLVLMVSCSRSAPPEARAAEAGGASPLAGSESPDGLDRCSLLKSNEVQDAIGEFHVDGATFQNEFGVQGCRWTSVKALTVKGFPDGWKDSLEVTVFQKDKEQWARHQASGVPMEGFGNGALYNDSYGQVWFDCGSRYCSVRARINNPAQRRDESRKLATLLRERVH